MMALQYPRSNIQFNLKRMIQLLSDNKESILLDFYENLNLRTTSIIVNFTFMKTVYRFAGLLLCFKKCNAVVYLIIYRICIKYTFIFIFGKPH